LPLFFNRKKARLAVIAGLLAIGLVASLIGLAGYSRTSRCETALATTVEHYCKAKLELEGSKAAYQKAKYAILENGAIAVDCGGPSTEGEGANKQGDPNQKKDEYNLFSGEPH
jgi:predicted lipoprotein